MEMPVLDGVVDEDGEMSANGEKERPRGSGGVDSELLISERREKENEK